MLKEYIKKISEYHDLTTEEMKNAMDIIMDGRAGSEQVSAFLIAMKMKKESPAEIAAASSVMVSKATPLPTSVKGIVDIVGTGGDCLNTFNISTTSSFVLCGAGLAVAKHGNRGVSSKSGSADTLEALHVNIALPPKKAAYLLEKVGITFLFAQTYHESMRHVGPIRQQLGLKTMFNILGPLTNPAHPDTYVIGAYNAEMADVMIHVYKEMGVKQAVVVHGDCGMDEVSMTGDTQNFSAARFANAYDEAGINAISILTERNYFQGGLENIAIARSVSDLPILRKDFILDAREVVQTKRIGANMMLLIVAMLDDAALREFYHMARFLELECIVEVHNEEELERALLLHPEIIGINNRDLHTFAVSLETTKRLAGRIPADISIVSESGIFTHEDMEYVREAGADAVLIGESFMRCANIRTHLQELKYGSCKAVRS